LYTYSATVVSKQVTGLEVTMQEERLPAHLWHEQADCTARNVRDRRFDTGAIFTAIATDYGWKLVTVRLSAGTGPTTWQN